MKLTCSKAINSMMNDSILKTKLISKELIFSQPGAFKQEELLFGLPEKIIQFGTGVLLRGLADYLVDKANKGGYFNGSVVVVKSTGNDTSEFNLQDNIYTVLEKGVKNGEDFHKNNLITCISRVLAAQTEWDAVLQCAADPAIQIVISNTTEAGLVYADEELTNEAPVSFPAKLTAYLWKRYHAFNGDAAKGMVILPTELVSDNGKVLKEYVLHHAENNKLEAGFINWITDSNHFCNTLVDRIVPGKSEKDDLITWNDEISFYDHLHFTAEPFLLWAIEGGEAVREKVTFAQADSRVVIAEDISGFKEQKLRILNGSNTLVVSPAYLAGLNTVYDTVKDELFTRYTIQLIEQEVIPTIIEKCPTAPVFAKEVLDRFSNPFVQYKLLNIALQHSSKMNSRVAATIIRYYSAFNAYPPLTMAGLASFFLFYTPAGQEGDTFYGERGDERYHYRDEHTAFLCNTLNGCTWDYKFEAEAPVFTVLNNQDIFTPELVALPGLVTTVAGLCCRLKKEGIRATIENYILS